MTTLWKRRSFLKVLGASVLPMASHVLLAQSGTDSAGPGERDWSGQVRVPYPDPDVIALDPRFQQYILFNSPIQRLHTGTLWAEGPAWNGVGRYLVWSDIPNNVQMRWIGDDSRVTSFRKPSGNSNGNTFDYQGRQLSCEHGSRRVVRYEANGSITVVADSFGGRRLNSPNDLVVHPDGSIWFTDPVYGISNRYEGNPAESELKPAVYRVDGDNGRVSLVTDEVGQPNGLCFSPDYSRLYVADTGNAETKTWEVNGASLRRGRVFAKPDQMADGLRCDVDGNIWAGAGRGVLVFAPDGDTIGLVRLPEICANVCFGSSKRNRLFMTASQSLYALYVATAGAHIC